MVARYTGRHIRQARHGAWVNNKRLHIRPGQQLLPAAAALTVAGVLIGGAGAAIHFSPTGRDNDVSSRSDPADFSAPDANAAGETAGGRRTGTEGQPASGLAAGHGAAESGSCEAAYYDEGWRTASGERFDPEALTAAHTQLPFNSVVRVTNQANGRSVVVRINDRGPYINGRCLDLSRAAFRSIASLGTGVIDVQYEVLTDSYQTLTEDAT